MGLFSGKRGIIMGVANERSLATGIAKVLTQEGASIGYSYLGDDRGKMLARLEKAVGDLSPAFAFPCNVQNDEDLDTFFDHVKSKWPTIDFLVHSIAFADMAELRIPTLNVSRQGFQKALDASAYSFIAAMQRAAPLMPAGSTALTLSYLGGERVIPGYNLMGVAKAALEASTQYLAFDLGAQDIRVNAISAGPVKTLASSGVGDFSSMLHWNAKASPLRRGITAEEVGGSAAYLLSHLSSGVTGEVLHVDAGYHVMGSPPLEVIETRS